ncbi:MAG: endonuclease/exonuclease/phosphatase family protein [Tannerella sp.]|jgi:endonuclease/exonuclease/phosphatase family metal-dependent hydrolase/predicted phosphodiesterase|nr:endonuclease/exonuclease/phosphatase family protein [Tannerella sp.]
MKKITLLVCFAALVFALNSQTYPQTENTIRVMSYNIRNANGMDNVLDYQRVADVITQVAPDVVAVQELDSVTNRSKGVDVLARLAGLTAMYHVYGASITYDGGKYGIGVLSKEKPVSWKRIPLPGREEARSLLLVEFRDYVLGCSHFSLTAEDRVASIPIINQAVKDYDKPVFLAGDLNAVPASQELGDLQDNWLILNDTAKYTIPSNQPRRTIDYILGYTPKGYTYSVWRTFVPDTQASDHLPVVADIRLKASQDDIFRSPAYLQNPAADGMTVMWLTNVPCHSWMEYGTDSQNMQQVQTWDEGIAYSYNTLNRIRLTGLKPGTRYYYRVYSREITLNQPYRKEFGETAVGNLASFTTLDNKRTDFTAVIFNDLHNNYPLFDKFIGQLKDIPYDFVFFNGDCIADPQTEDYAVNAISHYSRGIDAGNVPSFYLRGNHETRGAYAPFLWTLLGKSGVDHSYGAFNIGDTRFVLLDCGEDKPDSSSVYYGLNDFTQLRKDQAEFLKKEIASKEFKSAKKRVLLHHIPVYGVSERPYIPSRDLWGDILAKAPFDICLNAHTHRFNYTQKGKEGNIFPVVNGGGNNEQGATVMVLRKQDNQMTLTVLNANGETLLTLNL